jgi:arsenate reductase (thioredoxin)
MTILFVCLHGSAKSLIAAEHLNRLARARGLTIRGESMGTEPDEAVPAPVVRGLVGDGIDVGGYLPRLLDGQRVAEAAHVINFGCDLGLLGAEASSVELWDDMPLVSDGYAAARDAIVARVRVLLDQCVIGRVFIVTEEERRLASWSQTQCREHESIIRIE